MITIIMTTTDDGKKSASLTDVNGARTSSIIDNLQVDMNILHEAMDIAVEASKKGEKDNG